MPWSNIPKNKWPQMERCVKDVMAQGKAKPNAIAICHNSIMGTKKVDMSKAVWSTAYINDLPDSSFAYVESGKKDSSGKTTPRSLRHLPYKDANGKIDPAHVRNALARLNQTQIPASAKATARAKLVAAAKQVGIDVNGKSDNKFDFLKGGEKIVIRKTTTTEIVSDEELEKQAEYAGAKNKASFVDCMKQNMKDGMDMAEARKECKVQMKGKAEDGDPVDEPASPDASQGGPKAEEVAPEASGEGVVEEPKTEEAVVTEEVTPVEEVVPEVAPEESVVETPAEGTPVAESDKVTDLVKQVLNKIQKLEATLKKQDEPESNSATAVEGNSASTEGAAPEAPATPEVAPVAPEVAPEEPAADAVVEDVAPTEGASPEGAEVAKVYDVVNKIPGQLEKLEKAFDEKFGALETRIKNIEEQPAPSKVVSAQVVTKGGTPSPVSTRLAEINKELAELEEMKKNDIDRFQKERRWDRAFDLIAEKDQLRETEG